MAKDMTTNQDARNSDVRRLTPTEFEALDETGRAFYWDLVKRGQAVITVINGGILSQDRKSTREKVWRHKYHGELLERLKGRQTKILLIGGAVFIGVLTDLSKYEIILTAGKRSLTVMKHAIITAEEFGPRQEGAPKEDGGL